MSWSFIQFDQIIGIRRKCAHCFSLRYIHSSQRELQLSWIVPYRNLETVVPQIVAAQPDAAVFSGDLARLEELEGDYKKPVFAAKSDGGKKDGWGCFGKS